MGANSRMVRAKNNDFWHILQNHNLSLKALQAWLYMLRLKQTYNECITRIKHEVFLNILRFSESNPRILKMRNYALVASTKYNKTNVYFINLLNNSSQLWSFIDRGDTIHPTFYSYH